MEDLAVRQNNDSLRKLVFVARLVVDSSHQSESVQRHEFGRDILPLGNTIRKGKSLYPHTPCTYTMIQRFGVVGYGIWRKQWYDR